MRLLEAQLQQALTHPEFGVRLRALTYWSRSFSDDPSVMPLVIEAVRTYGRRSALPLLIEAAALPQPEAITQWVIDELDQPYDTHVLWQDNYRHALGLMLLNADPELLHHHREKLRCIETFPASLQMLLADRLRMRHWSWEECWAALQRWGEDLMSGREVCLGDERRMQQLLDAAARHPAAGRAAVLDVLRRQYLRELERLEWWLEPYLIELAGRMRLQRAVPYLLVRLGHGPDAATERVGEALTRIGTPRVIEAVGQIWPDVGPLTRLPLCQPLAHIHTDTAVEYCIDFLRREDDPDVQMKLAHAALSHFDDRAIEPVRQMLLDEQAPLSSKEKQLRWHLVTVATVCGVGLPEYDRWHEEAAHNNYGLDEQGIGRLTDDDGSGESCRFAGRETAEEGEAFLQVTRSGEGNQVIEYIIGRPVPKAQVHYPLGVIAYYGPDDLRTTKVVVYVIEQEGAAPLKKQWVQPEVMKDPTVEQTIWDFLDSKGVKEIVEGDRNIGCPHDEGKDYPVGEDCPFCPYWQRKR